MTDRTDRMARVNDLLRDTVAEVVAGELKDPRLDVPLLSVTEVRASRDLRHARALVSVMAEPNDSAEAQAASLQGALVALRSAEPFVHRMLRKKLRMKRIPLVAFERDDRIALSVEVNERLRALAAEGDGVDGAEEGLERFGSA